LEDRVTPAAYFVNVLGDSSGSNGGTGSGLTGDLRWCISEAMKNAEADTIDFDATVFGSAQTINLSSELSTNLSGDNRYGPTAFVVSNDTITISGSDAGVTLDGGSALRLFAVTGTATLTLQDLTFQNGSAVGTAGNVTGQRGGGGAGLGGAVFVDGGTLTVQGSTFTNNTAQGGAGGPGGSGTSPASDGGGLGGNGALGTFGAGGGKGSAGGLGGGGGGARFNFAGGAGGFGGGGGANGSGSAAPGAAGGFAGGAGSSDNQQTGPGGGGGGLGGAIFNNQGQVTLVNDTFTANTASGGLGFVAGSGLGGAVFSRNGTFTATFVTFSTNTAAQGGTDLYVLSDESDGGNGTSLGSGTAAVALTNVILGQSGVTAVSDFVAATNAGGSAPTQSGTNNLISNNPETGGFTGGTILGTDPMLGALASNSGPTQTMALLAGSPAFGAGVAVSGITTPKSPPDIGTFPRAAAGATVQFASGNSSVDASAGTFSIPITLTGDSSAEPTITTFASGIPLPTGLAFDAAGNLYVANYNAGSITQVTPAGVQTTFATGFTQPAGLAFDAAGNLYVANQPGSIDMVTPGGVVSVFATGFDEANDLVFDTAGNLYVASPNTSGVGYISMVTPAGVVTTFVAAIARPTGMVFDAAGNLYAANFDGNTVSKITPQGVVSTFASGFNSPNGVSIDQSGNLYVGNIGDGTVNRVTPEGVVSVFATGFSTPSDLIFDAANDLYVSIIGANSVSKVSSTVTVPFTLGGTAVDGVDYTGVTVSPLTFGIGQTTAYITGTLIDAGNFNRTLTVTLGEPTNASLGETAATTLTINLDVTAPSAPAVTSPTTTQAVNAAAFDITGTADAGSLVQVYQDVNNNGVIDAGDTLVGQQQLGVGLTDYSISTPLTQGAANDFLVTATDAAGNESPPTDVPTITADTVAPAAPVVADPKSAINVNAPTFTIEGDAEAGSLVKIYVDVNNNGEIDAGDTLVGQQQLGVETDSFSISTPLTANAANNFLVTATDLAGNESTLTDVPTITNDSITPDAPELTGTPPSFTNGTSVTFAFTSSDANFDHFEANLDGGEFTTATSPLTFGTLSEGSHTFQVQAVDTAGNVGTPTSFTWTIDLTVPTATITAAPPTLSISSSASFSFTGNDPLSNGVSSGVDHFETELDGGGFATATSPQTFSGLSEGSHTFLIRSIDAAGNVGDLVSYTWTVDVTAPTISISPPSVPSTLIGPVTYTVTYADYQNTTLDVGDITLNRTGTATGTVSVDMFGNIAIVTISAISGDGTLSISIAAGTAVDQGGNLAPAAGPSVALMVSNGPDRPVIDNTNFTPMLPAISTPVRTVPGGTLLSTLTANMTDPDGGALKGVAITAVNNKLGKWQYSVDSGTTWTNLPANQVSDTSAFLLADDGATLVRFIPAGPYRKGFSDLTYKAWDQSNGAVAETLGDTTDSEDMSFGLQTEFAWVAVGKTRVTVDTEGNPLFPALRENSRVSPARRVVGFLGLIAKEERFAPPTGIAISDADQTNGTWQYYVFGGPWKDFGTVSESAALLLGPNSLVRFKPNPNFDGQTTLTYHTWDNTTFKRGTRQDINSGAFSTNTETAILAMIPINSRPVLITSGVSLGSIARGTQSGERTFSSIMNASDLDSSSIGVAIIGSTGSGTWQYRPAGGNWTDVLKVTRTKALFLTAGTEVRFVSGPNAAAGLASLSFKAWDASFGVPGVHSVVHASSVSVATEVLRVAIS